MAGRRKQGSAEDGGGFVPLGPVYGSHVAPIQIESSDRVPYTADRPFVWEPFTEGYHAAVPCYGRTLVLCCGCYVQIINGAGCRIRSRGGSLDFCRPCFELFQATIAAVDPSLTLEEWRARRCESLGQDVREALGEPPPLRKRKARQ